MSENHSLSPQSALSLSFSLKSVPPAQLCGARQPAAPLSPTPQPPRPGFSEWALEVLLTSLVVLVDFFFNSLVVGVPCSLIFWHFWLFIDFRLVVILLLVM